MQLEATKSFATNQGNLIENIKGTIEANKEHVNMLTTAAEYNKEVVLKSLDDMKREAKTKFKAIAATIVEAGKVVVALPNLWDNIQENKVKIEENQKQVTDLLGKSVEQLSDMQRWLFESIEKVQEEVRKNELEIKEGIAKMKNDLMEEEENIKKMKVNIQVFDQKIQKKLEEYALLRSKLDERKKGLGFKENVRATFRPGGVESAAKITKEMERKVNETRNEIENLQGQLTEQKNELESAQANLALHANGLREITGLSSEMVEKCREMEENTAKLKVAVAQIPHNVGNIASRASNISGNTASATGDIATATAGSPASSDPSMLETMVTGMAGAGTGIATVAVGAGILMAVGAPLTVPLLGVTVVATGAAVGAIYVAKKAYEKLKKRLYVGGNSAASSSVTQGENKSKVSVNSAPSGSSTVVSSGVPHNALSSSGYTPLFSQSETMGNVQMSSQNDEQGSGRPSNQFLTSQLSSQGDQHSNVTPPSSRQQRRQPFSMPPSSSLVSSNQQPYNQLESNPMHSQSDQYSNVLPLSSSQFRSSTTQPSSQSRSIPLGSSTTLLYQRPSLGENDTGNSYVFGNFDD